MQFAPDMGRTRRWIEPGGPTVLSLFRERSFRSLLRSIFEPAVPAERRLGTIMRKMISAG
jgi:hypothetical protein